MEPRSYEIDAVHCIDRTSATPRGARRLLGSIRAFNRQIISAVRGTGQSLVTFRSAFVFYSDFWGNANASILETRFFDAMVEWKEVADETLRLEAETSASGASSGLEALSIAMDAKWLIDVDKGRRLIFVWSNSPAHPLERAHSERPPIYFRTGRAATDFASLGRAWDSMAASARGSIILMCPDLYPWSVISKEWANVVHFPSAAGKGLKGEAIEQVVEAAVLQFQD